jgi:hypothetical protein
MFLCVISLTTKKYLLYDREEGLMNFMHQLWTEDW